MGLSKKKITLVLLFVFSLTSLIAMAENEKLPLTATASSVYSTSSYYAVSNAVDGNFNTYWLGGMNKSPWWIMFDTGKINSVGTVKITWYSSQYAPSNYDIQVSNDGTTWENVHSALVGEYNQGGTEKVINRETRYMRLYITAVYNYPVLREFAAYSISTGGIPHLIRFQGILKDRTGTPLEGQFTLTFKLYNAEIGTTPLWQEVQDKVNIGDGLLDVELGSVNPINITFDKQLWLGVTVESDEEMTPRFKLTSVPYAFQAER